MTVEDVESGMVLHWQSETRPNKKSLWIVLEQLENAVIEGRRFNIFCLQSNACRHSAAVNEVTTYIFHHGNIHRFSVHSQI